MSKKVKGARRARTVKQVVKKKAWATVLMYM